jgi:hypothetical protein
MGHCGMRTQPPQCTRKPARMLPHARTQGADALSLAAVEMSEAKPGDGAAQRVGRGSGAAVAPLAALTTRAHVLKYIKCDVAGAYQMYEMAMRAYAGDASTYYDAALLFHPGASVDVGAEDVPRAEGLYRKAIAIDPPPLAGPKRDRGRGLVRAHAARRPSPCPRYARRRVCACSAG